MGDLSKLQSAETFNLVGTDSTGVETNAVGASANLDLFVRDAIDTAAVHGALSVTTTAVEAKVGASRQVGRKVLVVTPTNGTVYWGGSNAVTTTSGTPIFKNQQITFTFTDNVAVWLIGAITVDVRIVEGA